MAKKKDEYDLLEGVKELLGFYKENFENADYEVLEKKKYDNLIRCGIWMDLAGKYELDTLLTDKKYDEFWNKYYAVCKDKGVPDPNEGK